MKADFRVRAIQREDYAGWRPLWDGYNAFYGREGETALNEAITAKTWARFFVEGDPVRAFVAVNPANEIIGIVHLVLHASTSRFNDVCYLQDLFTRSDTRDQGVGRALIEAVAEFAAARACSRVYWTTHESNTVGRTLYDKVAKHIGFIVYGREL
jgi:GNAT superfamily N-acetyltransferase